MKYLELYSDYLICNAGSYAARGIAPNTTRKPKTGSSIGVAKAAKQLGLHESQLYAWRKQSEYTQSVSQREANLATENARLKRQLA